MTTLAIDIGGTKIAAAVCDENDSIIQRWRVPTPMDADAINQHIAEVYREAVAAGHTDIEAIGISAAGNVSADRKTLTFSANIPAWINYDLSEHVGALIDHAVPVVVENDANCAGWGEYVHGAGQGSSNMVALTVGTGLGGAIVINGQLVYGSDGFAGELGHVIMKRNNGRVCGCGRTGCLEAYCSATGVARTAREFLEVRTEPSLLRNMEIEDITSKDVYDAAMAGDKLAKEIFNYTGEILGEAFADMAAFSSPQAFILFGGLAKSGDLLLKPIKESFDKNVMPVFKGKSKILVSELKESDAAVLGASALGWEARYRYEAPHIEKIEEEL